MSANARNGFTLIELIAGLAAASLVAITAGIMLFFIQRASQDNQAMINVQEDGNVAMATIARVLRDAVWTNTDLSQPEQIDAATATGGVRTLFVDAASRRLYYRTESGDSMALTDRRVAASGFTYSNAPGAQDAIGVRLVLVGNEGPVALETVIRLRNR